MVEKVIRALKDFELKTLYGFHLLSEGEVKRIRFKGQRAFDSLLSLGLFDEAKRDEKESNSIPVIHPKVDENTIVGVEPIEKLDPPEGIDPDKPDLPCPETGVSLDEAGEPTTEETSEDRRQSEPSIEELTIEESTPEQETQDQVEVVEIGTRKVEATVEVKDKLIQKPIDVIDRV